MGCAGSQTCNGHHPGLRHRSRGARAGRPHRCRRPGRSAWLRCASPRTSRRQTRARGRRGRARSPPGSRGSSPRTIVQRCGPRRCGWCSASTSTSEDAVISSQKTIRPVDASQPRDHHQLHTSSGNADLDRAARRPVHAVSDAVDRGRHRHDRDPEHEDGAQGVELDANPAEREQIG